jgi:hypothetical protein
VLKEEKAESMAVYSAAVKVVEAGVAWGGGGEWAGWRGETMGGGDEKMGARGGGRRRGRGMRDAMLLGR